jgi:hypothetical protein
MVTLLRPVLLHLAGMRALEGSVGECKSASYAWILLDRVGFGCAHPYFYSNSLVLEGVARSSILCCHEMTFCSMVKSEVENIMKTGLVE